jgi:hypothetical protein
MKCPLGPKLVLSKEGGEKHGRQRAGRKGERRTEVKRN